ncbi:hypothetical protein [Curtobacterium sp. MCBD17_021]|uniref:hypothetical protein n=1 Tax=Curtobacterium sp. MCBD17_021 TaxID=2175665 RepID=UPI000DA94224|nr:hypothetical protein [Curtobacterium sp. MCBD17_021]PZE66892.1 hypothetical protein DEI83_06170 [Curtobacterium sp. MCBD17_021]
MGNIAKARQGYKPPTGTLRMVLDVELAKERNTLLQRIGAANDHVDELRREAGDRPVTPKLKKANDEVLRLNEELQALEEREREHVHLLHMTKLPGIEWNDIADKFPPRLDVQLDIDLGYNHHAVALVAARVNTVDVKEPLAEGEQRDEDGTYVEVDGVVHRGELLDDDDWDSIEEIASGWDIGNVVNLQLNLNVLQSSNRLGRLKKG